MKRTKFELGSVLKHYELQKQRTEFELQQASHALREIDDEITRLHDEIAALAKAMNADGATAWSAAGWIAGYRKSEHLGQQLADANVQRQRQADVVAQCSEKRKRWAIAEETLLSLRHKVEQANQTAEAKADQLLLQEAILRRWLNRESDEAIVM
jgi:hypothetical protein